MLGQEGESDEDDIKDVMKKAGLKKGVGLVSGPAGAAVGAALIVESIMARVTKPVERTAYRCTTQEGVYPSPVAILPPITEICLDFKGPLLCQDEYPSNAKDLEGWTALPVEHEYYKVRTLGVLRFWWP